MFRKSIMVLSLLLCSGLMLTTPALAQSQGVLTSVTNAGFQDKYHRNPQVSVRSEIKEDGSVTIFAAATARHSEYDQYPILVSFFINRQLFAKQLISPELPGPLGVDIGTDVATVPFNFAVIASLTAPNGSFSSSIYGSVNNNNFVRDLGCTLTINDGTDDEEDFFNNLVTPSQTGDNVFSLGFTGQSASESGRDATITATVTTAQNIGDDQKSATASVRLSVNSEVQTLAMSGTVTQDEDTNLERITLASSDSSSRLVCVEANS